MQVLTLHILEGSQAELKWGPPTSLFDVLKKKIFMQEVLAESRISR